MNEITTKKPPIWFWIISVIALIWNAMGVYQYLQQAYKTDAFKAMYTEEQLEMIYNTPSWALAAFAIAVFAGLLGCVALLLRKNWAKSLFLLSLIGIIVQLIYNVFISKALEVYGYGAVLMPFMVLIVGFLLYFFSKKAIDNNWIK